MSNPVKSIVLVHGGFVDGSGWQGVYKRLKADGYDVTVVDETADVVAEFRGRSRTLRAGS